MKSSIDWPRVAALCEPHLDPRQDETNQRRRRMLLQFAKLAGDRWLGEVRLEERFVAPAGMMRTYSLPGAPLYLVELLEWKPFRTSRTFTILGAAPAEVPHANPVASEFSC